MPNKALEPTPGGRGRVHRVPALGGILPRAARLNATPLARLSDQPAQSHMTSDNRVLSERYQELLTSVSRAITDADPIGLIRGGAPADEYQPEAAKLLPTLARATCIADVEQAVRDTFEDAFGRSGAPAPDGALFERLWQIVATFRSHAG
jgi:hypothetical protein